MRQVYLLHSVDGVHLIASNFKVIYEALLDLKHDIIHANLKSYSWYTFYLSSNLDVAVPRSGGGHYQISRRPVLAKYFGHLKRDICTIPSFSNPKK